VEIKFRHTLLQSVARVSEYELDRQLWRDYCWAVLAPRCATVKPGLVLSAFSAAARHLSQHQLPLVTRNVLNTRLTPAMLRVSAYV